MNVFYKLHGFMQWKIEVCGLNYFPITTDRTHRQKLQEIVIYARE